MSVLDDLARNRKIFERLTSSAAIALKKPDIQADADTPGGFGYTREPFEAVSPESVKAPAREELSGHRGSTPVENYSLEYGVRRQTGMALEFTAPGGPEYPSTREAAAPPESDVLESLYYQIDVEARMSSQLLSEEEL